MTEEAVILQIAIVVFVALASGILLQRFKQPDIVGYVLTGVVLGPSCCGLITSRDQVSVLAELGVLMLLFVIGLELNLQTFKKHFGSSLACVCMQVAAGLALSGFVALFFSWPSYFTVALGFVFALSSTAVVVNTLETFQVTSSGMGSLTIGILIAQDIAAVPMILTLKALTGGGGDWGLVAKVITSVAFMGLYLYCLGQLQKNYPKIDFGAYLGNNRDLYMLASLTVCFAAAAIAGGAGLTPPYGAFLAGLTLGNLSRKNEDFVGSIRPIQKVLLLVFFLSIGLLLDLKFVWHHLGTICLLLLLVTLAKTAANIAILRLLRVKLVQASFMGVAMAQLGEFSFLLITALEKQPDHSFEFAEKCLIALTVLSLMISPFWMKTARQLNKIRANADMPFSRLWDLLFGKTVASTKTGLSKTVRALGTGAGRLRKNLGTKSHQSKAPEVSVRASQTKSSGESSAGTETSPTEDANTTAEGGDTSS